MKFKQIFLILIVIAALAIILVPFFGQNPLNTHEDDIETQISLPKLFTDIELGDEKPKKGGALEYHLDQMPQPDKAPEPQAAERISEPVAEQNSLPADTDESSVAHEHQQNDQINKTDVEDINEPSAAEQELEHETSQPEMSDDEPVSHEQEPIPSQASFDFHAWVIQVGSFEQADYASALLQDLRESHYHAFSKTMDTKDGPRIKVYIGPEIDKKAAEALLAKLQQQQIDGILAPYHPAIMSVGFDA